MSATGCSRHSERVALARRRADAVRRRARARRGSPRSCALVARRDVEHLGRPGPGHRLRRGRRRAGRRRRAARTSTHLLLRPARALRSAALAAWIGGGDRPAGSGSASCCRGADRRRPRTCWRASSPARSAASSPRAHVRRRVQPDQLSATSCRTPSRRRSACWRCSGSCSARAPAAGVRGSRLAARRGRGRRGQPLTDPSTCSRWSSPASRGSSFARTPAAAPWRDAACLVAPAAAIPLVVYGPLPAAGPQRPAVREPLPASTRSPRPATPSCGRAPLTVSSFAELGVRLALYAAGVAALVIVARLIARGGRAGAWRAWSCWRSAPGALREPRRREPGGACATA